MHSANLSGPFRGCLYYALLGLPQATGLAGGYDFSRLGQAVLVSLSFFTSSKESPDSAEISSNESF